MSERITFYTNPQSRGAIIRWMLEELGVPYETVLLEYGAGMKDASYLAINPMGKVPAIKHGGAIITETPAICAYLADAYPEKGLAPAPGERADYYRWLFFAAGPIEAVFTAKAMGWEVPEDKQGMAGFGNAELALATIEGALEGRAFIAGNSFSAADVYLASQLNFMINFKLIETRPAFEAYLEPLRSRPAYIRAKKLDAPQSS